ncbi:hypothetical protein CC80DRAFT_24072 [Byssothecium circinans]|uniref:RING-type E3 ubiquitin transferase n=1 Tax=Byssothecium circinans TaxID=147558 RepID=A0A6A5U233_9PLEO|nr:hypothetical protein CC80DRAFT_24072 [Byssothecium circinans]
MRPLRLLLSLCTILIALTLVLYLIFGSQHDEELHTSSATQQKGKVKALFSFTSPGSLFPPSAIISLTDDNSTFFLARPAAFGPALPSSGLSGALWIGSGFGDEAMGTGELGCSDVPGWNDGSNVGILGLKSPPDMKAHERDHAEEEGTTTQAKHAREAMPAKKKSTWKNDGTDDHLRRPVPALTPPEANIQSMQEGAEIADKVVLLKRGGCGFLEKVKWAQRRGGVALIVGDDVRGGALVRMYARGDTSDVTIPALFTSHTTAHLLSSLLPTGGLMQDLSPQDVAKLRILKNGKGKKNKSAGKTTRKQEKTARPTTTQDGFKTAQTSQSTNNDMLAGAPSTGWFRSLLITLGFGDENTAQDDTRRPPSSGKIDWVQVDNWKEGGQNPVTSSPTPGDFVIGQQDWRDTAFLAPSTSTSAPPKQTPAPKSKTQGGSNLPSSGEYSRESEDSKGWFGNILGGKRESLQSSDSNSQEGSDASAASHSRHDVDAPNHHDGLWVTLTPTNMSSSPFFDTLLVLVVSPLVTLTVVYALLLLRSRIRRRRWRAPKSLVERLPVRTYHTISDNSPVPTPTASSPSTPLLSHSPPQAPSSPTRLRSQNEPEVPATSSSFLQPHRTPEEEKRESGLAAWRRRYGGRQKECVVCLEEYEDGVSQVMSLPCGHEFHADCITPWLVTRRRTCPICKGDVVRSLSQSYHDRTISTFQTRFRDSIDGEEDIQAQAVETRNDSPSASRPVPISSSSSNSGSNADIEANWADEEDEHEISRGQRTGDLSSSLREMSSSVATTIWRGFEAVGRAAGMQRRGSREEVDRDR